MGYQESWLVVQPQWCFPKLIRAYEQAARSGYYRTASVEPLSIVVLKQPFGELPKGTKILWVCGDRCFHTPSGVFDGNLKTAAKLRFIPVEQVLDLQDRRLEGIDLSSQMPSENAYMKRFCVKDYAARMRMQKEKSR